MQRSTKPLLPPNYKESLTVQIGWNGFYLKLCELNPKIKECDLIKSQVYDPDLGRLRPAEISQK
jgi:hypothetical protein